MLSPFSAPVGLGSSRPVHPSKVAPPRSVPPKKPAPVALTVPSTVTVPVARNAAIPPSPNDGSQSIASIESAAPTVTSVYSGTKTTCVLAEANASAIGESSASVLVDTLATRASSKRPVDWTERSISV